MLVLGRDWRCSKEHTGQIHVRKRSFDMLHIDGLGERDGPCDFDIRHGLSRKQPVTMVT